MFRECGSVTEARKSPSAKGSGRYSKGIITRIKKVDNRLSRLVERLRVNNARVTKIELVQKSILDYLEDE